MRTLSPRLFFRDKLLFGFIIPVLAVFAFAGDAAAQNEREQDVLRRLMAEPVTLFDWGLAQLDRDIAAAADRVLPNRLGLAMGRPATGTIYDWRANHITLYVSVALPAAQRSQQTCKAAFVDIVSMLTIGAPKGPKSAGWYLLNTFKPKAHFWGSRFEDVGSKLLQAVTLEISFIPATFEAFGAESKRVRCTGRLDAEPDEISVEVGS